MKLIYIGYKWREATGMELLLRGDEEVLKQIPAEPHAGDLKQRLAVYSDDTQVRLDFRGKTPFGELIDVSMPIECIGNSCTYDNGERKNLIYISGNGK